MIKVLVQLVFRLLPSSQWNQNSQEEADRDRRSFVASRSGRERSRSFSSGTGAPKRDLHHTQLNDEIIVKRKAQEVPFTLIWTLMTCQDYFVGHRFFLGMEADIV